MQSTVHRSFFLKKSEGKTHICITEVKKWLTSEEQQMWLVLWYFILIACCILKCMCLFACFLTLLRILVKCKCYYRMCDIIVRLRAQSITFFSFKTMDNHWYLNKSLLFSLESHTHSRCIGITVLESRLHLMFYLSK